uniref:RNA-directed RNA polymerase L n=1 Tax=Emaravirus cajani TaxID=1980429 RepID=A0A0U5DD24_9VIRU|nr:RNA dependent RNA polymerase [Emaravirus cajani]
MEGKKAKVFSANVSAVKDRSAFTEDILKKFLDIVGKNYMNYTISSKKREVELTYEQCKTSDGFVSELIKLAELILYQPPREEQLDIVVTVINLLELVRHDEFLTVLCGLLQSAGCTIVALEAKMKDVYPSCDSNLTPDVYFSDFQGNRYICEVKVRNKHTDLNLFYDKYSNVLRTYHVQDVQMSVINLHLGGVFEHGDYKITDMIDLNPESVENILYMIQLCKDLREKYERFPSITFFYSVSNFKMDSEDFIEPGFKEMCQNHETMAEFKRLFGPAWSSVERDMDNYSLLENFEQVSDDLMAANTILHEDCQSRTEDFLYHLKNNYHKTGKYRPTKLNNHSLVKLLDEKNQKYNIVTKYRPSIYIPIAKTVFLTEYNGSRKDFYRDAFVDMIPSGDPYARSVVNLLDSIFNTVSIEIILQRDSEIDIEVYKDFLEPAFVKHVSDKTTNYKKIATVTGITSDVTILTNNSFSINHCVDKHMNQNINGYNSIKYNKTIEAKDCLNMNSCLDDANELGDLLGELFNTKHHHGIYANDLVTLDNSNIHTHQCDIPESCRTKYLDHLYIQHTTFKSLIALNTVNSHKYRLIQTTDPGTILIMLPNADSIKDNPLRYFVITIITKDDEVSERANQLLGIHHHTIESSKYKIMVSKVVSLNMQRLKLLNHSFVKYCLLMTYYSNFKSKIGHSVHTLSWLLCQFITISSLSVTDTYKNFIMAIYSDYSNIDDLINDKLESRPKTLGQIYVLRKMFDGISSAVSQLQLIMKNKNEIEIDESGDLQNTGFNKNMRLKLPLSNIKVQNPREILHESFILFYLGNKGLHGSPQELLKLYSVPYKFEEEYKEMLSKYGTVIQEYGNESPMSFNYEVMVKTSKSVYSDLYNKRDVIRQNLIKELKFDKPLLSVKQFSSTKSMVSNSIVNNLTNEFKIPLDCDVLTLERKLDELEISNPDKFLVYANAEIERVNTKRREENSNVSLLPSLYIYVKGDTKFIKMHKYSYTKLLGDKFIKQNNAKVFDEFYRISEENNILNVKQAYKSLIHKDDLLVRIFYKDQRTAEDREIYTGNAQTRLCLYPIEMTFKTMCKYCPNEAITISGDQKQKKMLEQRLSLLKLKKQFKRDGFDSEIYSVSSDASKWSARDVFLKFIVTISTNPYLSSSEKWFFLYLMIRYYNKKIVLTDNIFSDMINLMSDDKVGIYEEMTSNCNQNWFPVRSNWLQGNLNHLSSFVHLTSTKYTETMLRIVSENNGLTSNMTCMVHSDDSTYDILINFGKPKDYKRLSHEFKKPSIGQLIIALITYSNKFHCITLNEKKTYISTFYKEFLSTTIVGDDLFFFYMSDLLPIASDTSYSSPLNDFASYSGYINNAFSHACPYDLIRVALILINHLTMSTYNMHYTSEKNPKNHIDSSDVPIQIYPRYKLPMDLAGVVPYYASDAFNILNDIIYRMHQSQSLKTAMIEEVITLEMLDEYLKTVKLNPKLLMYIKLCILCMDYTQYERDDEDPYNIIDYDLSQTSIINVISLNKGSRIKKTYTYKEYLANESNVRLTTAINPIWCISKPTDPELIKINILANYSNPNFRDSLIFSTPAIDYGRRIISSNRNMYTLSSHLMEKDKAKNISRIYADLSSKANSTIVTARDLQRYLSVYLFSDKKISVAVQVYYSKVEILHVNRPEYNRVIQPKSVYMEEYGQNSNTALFCNLLTDKKNEILNFDSKAETFIKTCEYVLNRFPDIKIYKDDNDIDDEYMEYYKFKYPLSVESPKIDVDVITVEDELSIVVYNNKIKFLSLMVRYFNDIKRTTIDRNFNMPSYPSPSSIVMTIDSLLKKSQISTKVYLSNIRTTKYEEYLLSRFGMYVFHDLHVKFKMGYKIRVATNNKLTPHVQAYRTTAEPLALCNKLISKDPDLFKDLVESNEFHCGNYSFDEFNEYNNVSNDINSTSFLYRIGLASRQKLQSSFYNDPLTYNYWVMPTNSDQNDPLASLVYYMHKGNIMKVRTIGIDGHVQFMMNYYKSFNTDWNILNTIKRKIQADYSEFLRNALVMRTPSRVDHSRLFMVNQYNRVSTNNMSNDRLICHINVGRIDDIKVDYIERDLRTYLCLTFKTQVEEMDMLIRIRENIDDEYMINCLIENIDNCPRQIANFLSDGSYLLEHPEYISHIYHYLGPGNLKSLMNGIRGQYICERIQLDRMGNIYQIGNYIKEKNGEHDILYKCSRLFLPICIEHNIDLEKKLNPEKFIKSSLSYKLGQVYNNTVTNFYKRSETHPYLNLFTLIMKTANLGNPLEKIAVFIISVFKFYPEDYNVSTDELEF